MPINTNWMKCSVTPSCWRNSIGSLWTGLSSPNFPLYLPWFRSTQSVQVFQKTLGPFPHVWVPRGPSFLCLYRSCASSPSVPSPLFHAVCTYHSNTAGTQPGEDPGVLSSCLSLFVLSPRTLRKLKEDKDHAGQLWILPMLASRYAHSCISHSWWVV